MLERKIEYVKMANTEENLWWYKSLHDLIYKQLRGFAKDKQIVDAGCGTGGLMQYLRRQGFLEIVGFDLSEHAIEICQGRSLNVFSGDIKQIRTYFDPNTKDLIISNDVFYFLSESEQIQFLKDCYALLREDGQLMMNLPALESFKGIHDLSVGVTKRLSKADFRKIANQTPFKSVEENYWPFLLSPIIFIVRLIQRLKLLFFKNTVVTSDVEMPSEWVNNWLYRLTKFEQKYMKWKPWGSSLFVILKK